GKDDCDIKSARHRLGSGAIIGVSCYGSIDTAERLAAEGADYLAFGAFHPSPTKPHAPRATLDVLRRAQVFRLPLVAIGGVTADNALPLIEAGADYVAVISAVFAAADIESATRRIAALFS
ncbi:MAG: thiamine phosphate synthase, partial [Dokdonella sp.]